MFMSGFKTHWQQRCWGDMTICFGDIDMFVKKAKTILYFISKTGGNSLFNHMFKTLAYWLIVTKRLYVCKTNSKVAIWWKILLVTVTSYCKNVCSCNRLILVVVLFIFACLLRTLLVLRHTTVSLHIISMIFIGCWKKRC